MTLLLSLLHGWLMVQSLRAELTILQCTFVFGETVSCAVTASDGIDISDSVSFTTVVGIDNEVVEEDSEDSEGLPSIGVAGTILSVAIAEDGSQKIE